MNEKGFMDRIQENNGKVYIVGGWVRDQLRQIKEKDKDYVITGITEMKFKTAFPTALKVGKSFPVYLLEIDGKICEIAFARKERKTGSGYKGFAVFYDASVTIEEDLYRRDTTMNSIALALPNGELIDPYRGQADIKNKKIRAISEHFLEDPVRALRAARQAAQTGFSIESETVLMMKACRTELICEPQARILKELTLALGSSQPSCFFRYLAEAEILAVTFPEIFALIGKTQPAAFHPEGDAFEHSMFILDQVAKKTERLEVRFSALVHDIGKGATKPDLLPHHYGHEIVGREILADWNRRMQLPKIWLQCATVIISEHMRAPHLKKIGKIIDLLLLLDKNPLRVEGFNLIIEADHKGLPAYLQEYKRYLQTIYKVRGTNKPAALQGIDIGIWIRQQRILACQKMLGVKMKW
ncbi:HD domain-containing protein [Propionispira raffinosivorans]|uniref:HD domain-containing protein n=1 Tax=Propionispira raffinosivorans TaxID=86959 RepID=UPI00037B17B3|nr:HD domain-containing protein [Propionispira raffinosivorans]